MTGTTGTVWGTGLKCYEIGQGKKNWKESMGLFTEVSIGPEYSWPTELLTGLLIKRKKINPEDCFCRLTCHSVNHWRHLISIRLVQPAVQDSTNQETMIFLGSRTRKLQMTVPIPVHTQGSGCSGAKAFFLQVGAFFLLATKTVEHTVSGSCRGSRKQTLGSSPSHCGDGSFLILASNSLNWSCV